MLPLVVLIVGIGFFSLRKEARVTEPHNQQVAAAIKKVVLKKFICKNPSSGFAGTRSYLKMTVSAGCQGMKPAWWGHYAAHLDFDHICFIDKDGHPHYLADSGRNATYNPSTQLYSRSCDIPIYDGRIYRNRRWESGYENHHWGKGGILKVMIQIWGGGWLYDDKGNLVRNYQSKAINVGFSGEFPFTAKIKAE
jgi:hypothetical protein